MAGLDNGVSFDWDWSKIHELGISSHMLGSCQRKDLTTLALVWLGINLEPFEKAVVKATDKARRICRSKQFKTDYGTWAIASDDRTDMPSGSAVKADMWLLRAMLRIAPEYVPEFLEGEDLKEHSWWNLCNEYANPDSATTVEIHKLQYGVIQERGLERIYNERRKLLPLVYKIEQKGVTVSLSRTKELTDKFLESSNRSEERCKLISEGAIDKLPISGASNQLRSVIFEKLGLVSPKKTEKGFPSLDKEVLNHWLNSETIRKDSKQHVFIRELQSFRKRMTAVNYMKSYQRFGILLSEDFLRLHPSLNMNGTNTLRWSSSNPNEQNISKQEGFNLRYTLGPPSGYAWASFDYENLELRIPAYEANETELVTLFENPDEPPYYGSNHLLNFHTIYPELWEPVLKEVGPKHVAEAIKKSYKSTWYQRCKNGWFAIQYGSVEVENTISTADRSFGKEGSHRILKQKLGKLEQLNQFWIRIAKETGFVSTLPDVQVDPEKGYPIECSRNSWGKISPTIPLNYHVQGTACWLIMIAMLEVQNYIESVGIDFHIIMQIHDELVILFKLRPGYKYHLRQIQSIMASCGIRIGIPLKVGCEIHEKHWASGVPL